MFLLFAVVQGLYLSLNCFESYIPGDAAGQAAKRVLSMFNAHLKPALCHSAANIPLILTYGNLSVDHATMRHKQNPGLNPQ